MRHFFGIFVKFLKYVFWILVNASRSEENEDMMITIMTIQWIEPEDCI